MITLLYIISGLSILFGAFIFVTASRYNFRHLGLTLGGISYIFGGLISINLMIWWPLIGGWITSFVVRKIFGDPTIKQ